MTLQNKYICVKWNIKYNNRYVEIQGIVCHKYLMNGYNEIC